MADRRRYIVADSVTRVLGREVRPGQELWLTEAEATTPLAERHVRVPGVTGAGFAAITTDRPSGGEERASGLSVRHPLDHDGDGRPGGGRPGPRRRRR